MIKIYFINRELGRGCQQSKVQGQTGKTYALARLCPAGYHKSDTITVEQYEKAIEDIARNWPRPMCRWVPMVEIDATVYGPSTASSQVIPVGPINGPTRETEEHSTQKRVPCGTPEELSKLPYFSLKKEARLRRIDPYAYTGRKDALVAAIVAAS